MIHLVVALIHEARPLIAHYRLQRLKGDHPYAIYGNAQFTLIISGIGKVASAAATAYLQAFSLDAGAVAWLNFGIAGHSDFKVGEGFIAHRILEQATAHVYYPPLIFPFPSVSSDLITVDRPEKDYRILGGYDMEASGYYQIALKSSSIEWVHCYKIVSDNPAQPIESMTKSSVMALISAKMEEIVAILSILKEEITAYRQIEMSADDLGPFTKRWHFTETQLSQLKALLFRMRTLHGNNGTAHFNLDDYQAAKPFLAALKKKLDADFLITRSQQTT